MLRLMVAAVIGAGGLACAPGGEDPPPGPEAVPDWSKLPAVAPDPELAAFGSRQAKYERLCSVPRGDSFWKAICGSGRRPAIPDLVALLKLLGLDQERAFAMTGNSTSLVAMSVTPLNPRMIVFPRVDGASLEPPADLIAIGFVRGEQLVEAVSRDWNGDYNFYLLAFEQRCSYQPGGCDLAALLTEEIEHNWTAYSVYDQDELEHTSFDCKSCHQPGGTGAKHILRMQELTSPWLHWFPQRFVQRTESDRVLLAQFAETHAGDKQYGGIPAQVIANAIDEGSAAQLEALIRAEGLGDQPNPFDSHIVAESAGGAASPTWQARFEANLRGEAIAVPYPAIDVADESRRTAAARSYREVVAGMAPRASLVDTRRIFSRDAEEKLSFLPMPGADGKTVLLQMCARCHDGRARPELTRSRFNVRKLDQLPRAEKDLAIARMNEPLETRMPPWRVGRMTPEALEAATLELRK